MGYATRLQRQFDVTQKLISDKEFGLLAKRRDKLAARVGTHTKKESAEFRTAVGGKQKQKGTSKAPRGWYSTGQFGK